VRPDAWLEVTGTYTPRQIKDDVNGGPIPFLDVSQARTVPAPRDQYES
jgi:putative membrane protein